ncbi:response regulator [Aureisphaera galaxeae]|uniref:LytR/AlgR family response regulator transcription factor n=1 Tax=Aureisphaera galaxeae TaxID=1538023 RepID=UPI00234FC2C8|nr:response regulator [Aureisphaera galaxeae]MDC8006044.1 response regulator [Aureisphaera galaxeae]
MKRAIIIDDEEYLRVQIREKLEKHFGEEILVIGEAATVKNGVKIIQSMKPDLLLLDIQLADGTGFDILSQLGHKDFQLIFITAFDHEAIKAIKVGALDYVLKPIDDDDFIAAIGKTIQEHRSTIEMHDHIEASQIHFKGLERKRIVLKTTSTYYTLLEDDIIYCKADGSYTHVYAVNEESIMVSKTLKMVEELLSEGQFVRCHNSYIVNKDHIVKYKVNGTLITSSGDKIPVSSRKKDSFIKRIFG